MKTFYLFISFSVLYSSSVNATGLPSANGYGLGWILFILAGMFFVPITYFNFKITKNGAKQGTKKLWVVFVFSIIGSLVVSVTLANIFFYPLLFLFAG